MIDVGGTTTDVGSVEHGEIATDRRGGSPACHLVPDEQRALGRRRGQFHHRAVERPASRSARDVGAAPGPAMLRLRRSATRPSPTSTCCSGYWTRRPTWTAGSPRRRTRPGRSITESRRRAVGDQPRGGPDAHGGGILPDAWQQPFADIEIRTTPRSAALWGRGPDERLRGGAAGRRKPVLVPSWLRFLRLRDQLLRHRQTYEAGVPE